MNNPFLTRHIRSFVMRRGHITASQRNTWARLNAIWGIPFVSKHIDFKELFGRDGPVILEIGFGMGETTATMARANPHWNLLGVEVYRPGVGALLGRIEKEGIKNIRIIEHDVIEVLAQMIPDESLDAVHIYFPDPWPKKRHHKRRLIQHEFLAARGRDRQHTRFLAQVAGHPTLLGSASILAADAAGVEPPRPPRRAVG